MKMKVAVIMGSESDWAVMKAAVDVLKDFGCEFEAQIVSAHRTPEKMFEFAKSAEKNSYSVIIAGAGGAAHLPGMVAALTPLPVIGVPISSTDLKGVDSLLSILQMPKSVPVATVAVDGAANAALLALRILGVSEPSIRQKVSSYQKEIERTVLAMSLPE
jgi:5-(carboxyamino)imidazole ribonucleotide mutase